MPKQDLILIIGNGRSVLEYSFGEQINKFLVVGRINNYSTIKFEDYIGQKTDIWFNAADQNLKKKNKNPNEIVVFIPREILYRKGERIHNRISKRLNISKEEYSLVPIETMEQFEEQLGVTRLTTGTSSILWALENYQTVVIHGFDFFIDSNSDYNENVINKWLIDWGIKKKGGKHDLTVEKQFIENQIKENKLIQLKEYLSP